MCVAVYKSTHKVAASCICDQIWELMEIFVQIVLFVPSECAFDCALIGAIDGVIGTAIAKL